jgi:hypothetical protein
MIWGANSADSRAKRSTNQPDDVYLLIPSYDFFQNLFFGKLIDYTITGYAPISWQPIYNINKPVAFRAYACRLFEWVDLGAEKESDPHSKERGNCYLKPLSAIGGRGFSLGRVSSCFNCLPVSPGLFTLADNRC